MPNGYFQQQSPWSTVSSGDNGLNGFFNSLLQRRLMQQHAQQLQFENQMKMKEFGLRSEELGMERQKTEAELGYKKQLGLQAGAETAKTSEELTKMQESRQKAETIGLLSNLSKRLQIQPTAAGDPAAQAIQDSGPALLAGGVGGGQPQYMDRGQFAKLVKAALTGQMTALATQTPQGAEQLLIQPEKQQMALDMLRQRLSSAEGMNDARLAQREAEMVQKPTLQAEHERAAMNRTLVTGTSRLGSATSADQEKLLGQMQEQAGGSPVVQGNNTGLKVLRITHPDGTVRQFNQPSQEATPTVPPPAEPPAQEEHPAWEGSVAQPPSAPTAPAIPQIPSVGKRTMRELSMGPVPDFRNSVTKQLMMNTVANAMTNPGKQKATIRRPTRPGEPIPQDQQDLYLNASSGDLNLAKRLAAKDGWNWD